MTPAVRSHPPNLTVPGKQGCASGLVHTSLLSDLSALQFHPKGGVTQSSQVGVPDVFKPGTEKVVNKMVPYCKECSVSESLVWGDLQVPVTQLMPEG